jgi:hypothetical protein
VAADSVESPPLEQEEVAQEAVVAICRGLKSAQFENWAIFGDV